MPFPGALKALALTAEVTNTRSPQTIGDDQPRPGRSAVQATCSVVDHDTGSRASSAMPAAFGPRNCGQPGLAARTTGVRTTPAITRLARMRMLDATADGTGPEGGSSHGRVLLAQAG